jgi:formate hydrogenlyase subunit 6/NADH:ubiquinone oxidoreductase subunit I
MRYPKVRELKEAIISLFTPAYTTSFPFKEHVPADKFRGKPVVDDSNCIGCLSCANVCPSGAIIVSDDKDSASRTITRDFGKCIFCGQCEAFCMTGKGVRLSNTIYDMATLDQQSNIEKQEKELVVCMNCGDIITTREHVIYMFNKLGPRGYSSTLNLNLLNESLNISTGDTSVGIRDELKRKDMFNILCPNCQRVIQVKNLL